MDDSESPSPPRPTLPDPWASVPVPLTGPLERTSFAVGMVQWATGLIGLGVAFIAFQFVVAPVVLVALLGVEGLQSLGRPEDLMRYTRELILANSAGQILGLAAVTLLLTRLHTPRAAGFLRLRMPDGTLVGLAAAGVIVLQPVVQWLAAVNQDLPVPDAFRALDESQRQLIEQVMQGDLGLFFGLTMLAVVPGICEEVLFRGYAQRQFERGLGTAGGIVLSGVLFGLYHLRPSQLIPLAVLGIYLAYLTWRTGSLWPAIIVHFLHNGIAVSGTHWAKQQGYDIASMDTLSVPGYAIGAGAVLFGGILYILHRRAAALLKERAVSSSSSPPTDHAL